MSTPEMMPSDEISRTLRRRSPSVVLPEDLSLEELAQYWTLFAADRAEIMRCRNDTTRRRFAVQLCTLWLCGRFLPETTPAPVTITN